MSDRKDVSKEDLVILNAMEERLSKLISLHSKTRFQFLRAEAVIVQNIAGTESELKTFADGLAVSAGIERDDLPNWKLDFEEGAFISLEEDEPTLEQEIVPEPEPEPVVEEKVDPAAKFLAEMRAKYKR